MKGNNSTNSNDISPAWNTGKELKWQAFKCLQQIHAWFLNSSNQEGNVIKTQSWPPEWLKWETGLAGKDSKDTDAGILTGCLTAVKMSWTTLGHCWPKRWSTSLSTTRKFHVRQSTKQKNCLCTYHPTKTESTHYSPVHKETALWPPAGLPTDRLWHGDSGLPWNKEKQTDWLSRAISTVGTKLLTERTKLYEVCIMWLYLCEQQIPQNQRRFTGFYAEKMTWIKLRYFKTPQGSKHPEVLLSCKPPTLVAVP